MYKPLTLKLATLLMVFPQIVETIYSPALVDIAQSFRVPPNMAGQTLSCYFVAFAFGVAFWGRLSDLIGRRPTLLAGLSLYAFASILALFCRDFSTLLLARILAAFGAAVGSVITQVAMRDLFSPQKLTQAYATIGVAIALSPAFGVLMGSELTQKYGYQGVFLALALLALVLLGYSAYSMPETRPLEMNKIPVKQVALWMMRDSQIRHITVLIAAFNISLFSYYQLAPFMLKILQAPSQLLGYSGGVIAVGVLVGSVLNRHWVKKKYAFNRIMLIAGLIQGVGSLGVYVLQESLLFIIPMAWVSLAYALAIPHLLAHALVHYKACAGTASALLGFSYYTLLGLGLIITSFIQNIGIVLLITSVLIGFFFISFMKQPKKVSHHHIS
tara:strand:+ start:1462 stop:2619 length:1158 start_codon:yes stop_codon:yes gene_type:complete